MFRVENVADDAPDIGLFATCLVDSMRPSIGFAAVALLERAGCRVHVPRDQACCGQPAYNAGDAATAADIARRVIAAFEGFDYVVAPSGSCAAMLRRHFPTLLKDDPGWAGRATALAAKSWELVSFLTDVMKVTDTGAAHRGSAAWHDGCSGLRELGVKAQPRALLAQVKGLTVKDLPNAETCCGFGGTFCVKYPEISDAMVADKAREIAESGADMVLAGDLGCLLNISGKLARIGSTIRGRHVAEVLAGMTDTPPIGCGKE
jgi:L-lactate dehydrogenase complex protein LldE